jgi:hypothetical protein
MDKQLENDKKLLAERVKNVVSLIDHEGSNEPLPATHLITHKINISIDNNKNETISLPAQTKGEITKRNR